MADKKYEKKEVRRTEEGLYICDRCGDYFEEEDMTRGRFGIIGICKKCTGKAHAEGAKLRKQKQDAMRNELQDLRIEVAELKRQLAERNTNTLLHVTPREMLVRLRELGYDGQLKYTQVKTIDLSRLD